MFDYFKNWSKHVRMFMDVERCRRRQSLPRGGTGRWDVGLERVESAEALALRNERASRQKQTRSTNNTKLWPLSRQLTWQPKQLKFVQRKNLELKYNYLFVWHIGVQISTDGPRQHQMKVILCFTLLYYLVPLVDLAVENQHNLRFNTQDSLIVGEWWLTGYKCRDIFVRIHMEW